METVSVTYNRLPKFLVIDEFLPASQLADLLEFALQNRSSFHPTEFMRGSASIIDPSVRLSGECEVGLGPHRPAFKAAIHSRLEEFFRSLGIRPFEVVRTETQLIAHGNNAFYAPHIDTHTGADHDIEKHYRVVSCVYYFFREPKQFTGGEIALFPFGESDDAVLVEPLQNRLIVFPSFAKHEVRKVFSPSEEFANSRFAVNCWLRKEKELANGDSPSNQP